MPDKTQVSQDAANAATTVAQAAASAASAVATAAAVASSGVNIDISYIKRDIGNIDKKLDGMTGVFATKQEVSEISRIQTDHETRTRWLEQSIWKFIGASSIISLVIGLVVSLILKFVK